MNRVALVAAVAFLLSASAAGAQPSITVCEHRDFQGRCITLQHGVGDLREWGFSNRISSFRIERGTWRLCTGFDLGGRCHDFSMSVRDLVGTPLQDSVSSLRPVRGFGGRSGSGGGAIVLYTQPNFRGRSWVFSEDVDDLARLGLNDMVSSLRVLDGRWQICIDSRFRGCRTVSGSIRDLREYGWNNRISSIREEGLRGGDYAGDFGARGGRRGWGAENRPGVVLFDSRSFRGNSYEVFGEVRDLADVDFNDRTFSIRVLGGRWEVCVDSGFRGRCRVIDRDTGRLGSDFEGRISSIRPY